MFAVDVYVNHVWIFFNKFSQIKVIMLIRTLPSCPKYFLFYSLNFLLFSVITPSIP